MFKSLMAACLMTMVFLFGGAQGWSDDMEDRFVGADLDSSKSIFIDVKGSSLDNVLKIISQQSGLSFVASQDVADRQITLYLNKIPLSQALQTVLDANGLTYEMQSDTNVFVVKQKPTTAKSLITKVYQLKYATVSSSALFSTISTSSSADASSFSSAAPVTVVGGSSSSGDSSSSGSAAGGANASGGLETVLKNSLSPDGKVVEDVRTNSLIITDNPAQFPIIDSTIARLDVPIPQVLIEVEMIDVSKSKADQLGISYGATPLTFTGGSKIENWPFGSGVGSLSGGSSSSSSGSGSSSSSSSGSSSGSGSGSGSSGPTTGWNANGLTVALNFLTTTTDARILARPRILTLNNQTALIQITTESVVGYSSTTTTSSSGSSSSSAPIYTPIRYPTGVTLKVTPQANLDTGEVTMAVEPKDTTVIQSQVQPPNPSVNGISYDPEIRSSDSILELKDGQSMMIGGLMDNTTTNIVTKLPVLGDLPFLGAAFRSKNYTKTERELIIFLTPHIIRNSQQLEQPKDNSSIASGDLENQEALNRSEKINDSLDNYEK